MRYNYLFFGYKLYNLSFLITTLEKILKTAADTTVYNPRVTERRKQPN